jgi:carbon-monoxide dehydrogenase medium subunit
VFTRAFRYERAQRYADACDLLREHGEEAKVLAGGQSLLPMINLGLVQPGLVVDISRLAEGRELTVTGDGYLVLGALVTHARLAADPAARAAQPLLPAAAGQIGNTRVRNRGTLGGSLAHADPAADWPAIMIALGAEMVCEGAKGRRTVKVDDWFKGLMSTALGDDELLVEVRVPLLAAGTGAAYLKFPHPASRFAVVGVAAAVTLDKQGTCTKVGVGVTGAGTHAVRAKGVEAGCTGKKLDAATIEAAAQKAAEGVDVQADLQGSVEYKSHLCRVFAKRALTEAVKRAS